MGNSRRAKRNVKQSAAAAASQPGPTQKSNKGRTLLKYGAWVLGAGAVALLIVFVSRDVSDHPQARPDPPVGIESVNVSHPAHVEGPIAYDTAPPAGGPHNPVWLQCQVYDEAVPNENAVHALEHGAVWLAYEPSLVNESDIGRLEGKGRRQLVIVSPYPGIESAVVVTAWGVRLAVDSADDDRIDQFVSAFIDSPLVPEPGASC